MGDVWDGAKESGRHAVGLFRAVANVADGAKKKLEPGLDNLVVSLAGASTALALPYQMIDDGYTLAGSVLLAAGGAATGIAANWARKVPESERVKKELLERREITDNYKPKRNISLLTERIATKPDGTWNGRPRRFGRAANWAVLGVSALAINNAAYNIDAPHIEWLPDAKATTLYEGAKSAARAFSKGDVSLPDLRSEGESRTLPTRVTGDYKLPRPGVSELTYVGDGELPSASFHPDRLGWIQRAERMRSITERVAKAYGCALDGDDLLAIHLHETRGGQQLYNEESSASGHFHIINETADSLRLNTARAHPEYANKSASELIALLPESELAKIDERFHPVKSTDAAARLACDNESRLGLDRDGAVLAHYHPDLHNGDFLRRVNETKHLIQNSPLRQRAADDFLERNGFTLDEYAQKWEEVLNRDFQGDAYIRIMGSTR